MRTEISDIIQSFFIRFSQEFRSRNLEAFEIIIALAISHAYGCYNPSFSAKGASGTVSFLASGDRLATVELVRLVASPSEQYGYNFVPLSLFDK